MTPDEQLLRRFVDYHDQTAFRDWVELRLNLVHSVALRLLNGDIHLAQDVAQQVFTDAAKKASSLVAHPSPIGWLFTSTRFLALKQVRSHQRRRQRESTAAMNHLAPEPHVDWAAVRPVIDEALNALPTPDRDAILQRYYEQSNYTAIGAHHNLTPNAARMRVDRALDKLSVQLRRRGITSTATALGAALGSNAITAAPTGLAASITAHALTITATTTVASTTALITMIKAPLIATTIVIATGVTLISQETRHHGTLLQSTPSPAAQSLPATAPANSASTNIAPSASPPQPAVSDADYATLAQEVSTLEDRLVALDRVANSKLYDLNITGKIFPVNELEQVPRPSMQARPIYPPTMQKRGIEGQAVIAITIDTQGKVRGLETIQTTHEVFAEAALAAVSQWQFEPGKIAATPVNTRINIPIKFTINGKGPTIDEWF